MINPRIWQQRPRLVTFLLVPTLLLIVCGFQLTSRTSLRGMVGSSHLFPFYSAPLNVGKLVRLLREARLSLSTNSGNQAVLRNELRSQLHDLRREVAKTLQVLEAGNMLPHAEGDRISWLSQQERAVNPDLEITVPFFMYEGPEFEAFWHKCSFTLEGKLGSGGHMGEYYIKTQLEHHRWRVHDPAQAILFVVPVFLGAALDGLCGGEEGGRELILEVTKRLEGEPYFQRYSGNDHLFMGTHYKIFWWFRDIGKDPTLKTWTKLIWGRFMAAFEESFCPLLAPYSTLLEFSQEPYASEIAEKRHRVSINDYLADRPYSFFFVGRAFYEHHRGGYATRRSLLSRIAHYKSPNVIITTLAPEDASIPPCSPDGPYEGCVMEHQPDFYVKHALKSKWHFMVRGDDWSSSRLYDSIHSGSLIVAISDGLLDKVLPFGCDVDWDSIIIQIPEVEFRADPEAALERYVPDWETPEGRVDMQRRLNALRDAQRALVWSLPDSRTAETFLLTAARRCLPEAFLLRRNATNNYSWGSGSSGQPLRSLKELPCAYTDYAKGRYVPGRHGVGAFQEGWNQDD